MIMIQIVLGLATLIAISPINPIIAISSTIIIIYYCIIFYC